MLKSLLLTVSVCCFSIVASAEFYQVNSMACDQFQKAPTQNERVYIDLNQQVFGLGHTDSSTGCRVVDFYTVVVVQNSSQGAALVPHSPIGRRSSCQEQILTFNGPTFSRALISNNFVILENTSSPNCSELKLSIQPRQN